MEQGRHRTEKNETAYMNRIMITIAMNVPHGQNKMSKQDIQTHFFQDMKQI